ncbi:porin family protein [Flavobacterium pedocola]
MRKILLAVLALGFAVSVGAQTKGDVEFGVNLGFNSSSVSSQDDTSEYSSGINFGGSIDYYFSDRWSIKGKLIYDQKGWDEGFIYIDSNDPMFPSGYYETDYNLNYLTIPVMANWHFGKKRNWYLNFGPYVGFLMDAKETRFDLDVKDAFNSTDAGLAFGIGVKIPLNDKLRLFIEYEGQAGLSDLFEYTEEDNYTNSRGALNIGLNFKMK